jgi:predicted naringenin-chalcone synthase
MAYLFNLSCKLPEFRLKQSDVGLFMQDQYDFDDTEKTKLKLMYGRSGIDYRYSCIDDFNINNPVKTLFHNHQLIGVGKRMEVFFDKALPLAKEAALGSLQNEKITHLITVSCTGMAAPGLDLMLLSELNLPLTTHRSSVNFMGCYALFHALKIADAYCKADENAKVLIVAVELCTLHFNYIKSSDQIAANLLFGDGAAAMIVGSHKPATNKYFSISSFYAKVIPKGAADMAWEIDESGFLMTLSAYIPQLIEEGIGEIIADVLSNAAINQSQVKHWAFHPGGRKILDQIIKEMKLEQSQLSSSYQVLKEVGNLSSATLGFVLNHILEQENYSSDQATFAAGFGPGLTIETMMLNCK